MSQSLQTELREKINEAKRRLPLPQLLEKLGLAAHAKKSAHCPFPDHEDKHPSFSAFQGTGGLWFWKCHAGCGEGDEILFLSKLKGLSLTSAMNLYLEMAGFPPRAHKSHEYHQSRECPEFPGCPESLEYHVSPVHPVSNGQRLDGEREKVLKALAARNACTERSTARKRRFKLLRDLRAIEKGTTRELEIADLMVAFHEWHRLSQPFLDPAKARDDYLAAFLAELGKVRVPTGDGDTLNKAREAVSKLAPSELPVIPGMPVGPESWRRLAALHRELSRLSGGKTHFLSCRDAAKACPDLSRQAAWNANGALAQLGVIKIVRVGDARPNGKASEFQYLLSQSENGAEENDEGIEI